MSRSSRFEYSTIALEILENVVLDILEQGRHWEPPLSMG